MFFRPAAFFAFFVFVAFFFSCRRRATTADWSASARRTFCGSLALPPFAAAPWALVVRASGADVRLACLC